MHTDGLHRLQWGIEESLWPLRHLLLVGDIPLDLLGQPGESPLPRSARKGVCVIGLVVPSFFRPRPAHAPRRVLSGSDCETRPNQGGALGRPKSVWSRCFGSGRVDQCKTMETERRGATSPQNVCSLVVGLEPLVKKAAAWLQRSWSFFNAPQVHRSVW